MNTDTHEPVEYRAVMEAMHVLGGIPMDTVRKAFLDDAADDELTILQTRLDEAARVLS